MNTVFSVCILSLVLLNAFQLYFWSRQMQLLVDKLMSRNYAEYKQVETVAASAVFPRQHQDPISSDQDDINLLNQGILGL